MFKNGPKAGFFYFLRKPCHQICLEFVLNESSYGSITLRKMHAWEKPGPQVIAKNGSRPMRFQYSLIVNISLID